MPPPNARINVGIADDQPIVRKALRYYVEEEHDLCVIGEAGTGREAIDLVRTSPVDVLLLDIEMPGQSGLDALCAIRASAKVPSLAVLFLSGYPESSYALRLLRSGASGYLNKSGAPAEIVAAIRRVAQGHRYITPAVAELLAAELLGEAAQPAGDELSTRELQTLVKVAQGCSAHEVAYELSVSPRTVGSYRRALMRKLHARSDGDLTYFAVKQHLVE